MSSGYDTTTKGAATRRFHAEYAWLPGQVEPSPDVLVEVEGGRFSSVTVGVPAPSGVTRLRGLALPGLANAHSHAFHRALRGHTHTERGTFWSWRDRMYEVAGVLDPDRYLALARATYAEMALAGITCVGEFHYLHHNPDGTPYAEPNAMGEALVEAAAAAGIRITLLDTLYLTSTVEGEPLRGVQRRFGDRDLDAWSARHESLRPAPHARIGSALHSVRAVPLSALSAFAYRNQGVPLHFHLSEQRAENEASVARHGCTPTQLLADMGVLGPTATAVHATHLTGTDLDLLGSSGTGACLCPTTERDLADGIGPARTLADSGSPLSLGSDSHAVIDLFEEARAVELDERLRTERRGHFAPDELTHAATAAGHAALGWDDAGMIAVGARADLTTVRLDSVRTAAVPAAGAFFAATAADVTDVLVDGRVVVRDGRHVSIDVAAELARSIGELTRSTPELARSTPEPARSIGELRS
ncbi:formimidoylglutamate deiminase [Micromonospora sp. NPDC050397]|uniref:formimidoylglutamate deiminase n=1 Tax=Micromonospora sp. NPDC050397 TaxID=3364279 RepID=UPI00384B7663